jgi:uncharacterized small protein (DUF1192 family)
MKRASIALVFLMVAVSIAATYNGYTSPTILVDGEAFNADVPAIIVDGRTLAPVRALAERLGYAVGWDELQQIVTLESPGPITDVEEVIAALQAQIVGLEQERDTLKAERDALKTENAALKAQIRGVPQLPADAPRVKVGGIYENESLRLCVTEIRLTEEKLFPGLPYRLDLCYWVEAKSVPVRVNVDSLKFEFDAEIASQLNNGGFAPSDTIGVLEPGNRLERTYSWRIDTDKPGIRTIVVFWPNFRTAMVVFEP